MEKQICLSHLTVYDSNKIESEITEFDLMQLASNAYCAFNDELQKQPKEFTVNGYLIEMPQQKPMLPREKHLPDAPITTKWQKFAQEKGIRQKRRDRFVFDNKTQTERPRYGMGRTTANSKLYDPLIEVKDRSVKDPFGEEKRSKRERVEKNIKQ